MGEVIPFPGQDPVGSARSTRSEKGTPTAKPSAGKSGSHDPAGKPSRPRADGALPDEALHSRTRRAAPEARALAAEQAGDDRRKYVAAVMTAEAERLIAGGKVIPARITIALDIRELHGPEVDDHVGTYHGNPDGDVDRWEQALAVPSAEQVRLLAELTDFPLAWFYRPIKPGPVTDGPIMMCFPRRCELVQPHVITDDGVLLYEGQPRDPVDTCTPPLPGMPAPEVAPARKRVPAATTTPRTPRPKKAAKKTPPAEQLTVPNRMPADLRAELDRMFAERKTRR
jgi:hypothetical protein